MSEKPLGHKAYGSIPHLPSSRTGPSDSHIHEGQARICTSEARDGKDEIIVQEKLDGSCCAIAKHGDEILALSRSGYPATTSPYEQHHVFGHWVRERWVLFDGLLEDGERVVGEWMALAHGTIYDTEHPGWSPFVAFDLMQGHERATLDVLTARLSDIEIQTPAVLHRGDPLPVERAREIMEPSRHGADQTEGVVYRVERDGVVDFLAKWVRHDKEDGCYLDDDIWLWRPA